PRPNLSDALGRLPYLVREPLHCRMWHPLVLLVRPPPRHGGPQDGLFSIRQQSKAGFQQLQSLALGRWNPVGISLCDAAESLHLVLIHDAYFWLPSEPVVDKIFHNPDEPSAGLSLLDSRLTDLGMIERCCAMKCFHQGILDHVFHSFHAKQI